MKRCLCMIFSLLFAVFACSVPASAAVTTIASGTCGNSLTWTLTDSNALIISGTGAMSNYNNVNSYTPWYSYREQITSVSVGSGVTTVGNHAFDGFISITYVSLPDSVTSIGTQSFMDCSRLTGIRLSNNLISIGKWAFVDCTGLSSVTIPNSVTEIGERAFGGCSVLSNVTLGTAVKTIGASAFTACTAVNSINIPNSVTTIGEFAFYKTGLSSIVIPDSVTTIGRCAFEYCESLSSVTLSNNLTTISNYLFGYCKGLKSITLPEKITAIGESAFIGCIGLKNVNIPDAVTQIGSDAFQDCESLTSISIPNKVTTINTGTFYRCKKLKSVTLWNSVTNIGLIAFSDCPVSDVYFYGNSEDWNDITFKSSNDPLLSANIHYLTYYTLTYNANGGTSAPATQTGSGSITLSSTRPTRCGYTFLGWATSASATSAQYQPGASFNLTANTTLYAIWKSNGGTAATYTLTYNANGGTGAPPSQTSSNGSVTLSNVKPTRSGYEFLGWALSSSETEAKFQPGDICNLYGNATLYAIWKINPTANAVINVRSSAAVDYRSRVRITATASNVPEGYQLVICDGKTLLQRGDNKSVTYDAGEMTASKTYTVYVVVKDGTAIQKNSDGLLEKNCEVKVNGGFFAVLIAFFKGLFGSLPNVEIKP